jgi:tRNA-splicing ligase RtcB
MQMILDGKNVPIKIWSEEVEDEAKKQLHNVAALPWVFHHVAVMPDVHAGYGTTVGSVVALKDALSPSCVGVDIGCGMAAIKTSLKANQLPDNLKAIRAQIERDIPTGFNAHKDVSGRNRLIEKNNPDLNNRIIQLYMNYVGLTEKPNDNRSIEQLGTLGGGNHFIELCLDTEDNVWMMLHSGSRNIGKVLAEVHIAKAKEMAHNADLPDKDLAVFLAGTREMSYYYYDLSWAQEYALLNREVMLELYKNALKRFFPTITFGDVIACHHNYVAKEMHFGEEVYVTRKGAISAKAGELGIIPGSMGAKSFIVEGLGNPDSFTSASHGAGRRMSRGQARRSYDINDLIAQTAGVECRKDKDVIDEIPMAYKNIDEVMANQQDLVKIVTTLKQVLCVKGN